MFTPQYQTIIPSVLGRMAEGKRILLHKKYAGLFDVRIFGIIQGQEESPRTGDSKNPVKSRKPSKPCGGETAA